MTRRRVRRRDALAGLAGGLVASWAARAEAQGAVLSSEVFFAGMAYLANFEDIPKVLPCTYQLISKDNGSAFDKMLAQMAAQAPCEVRINTGGLGQLAAGKTAYVMALAIDREISDVERIGATYKMRCEVWGQILVFDFSTRSIVSSIPLVAQYIDALPSPPTQDDIAAGFGKLLFSDDPNCVKAQFAAKLSGRIMPHTAARTIRVTGATLSDLARQQVDGLGMDASGTFAAHMASSFTGWLTADQKICALPAAASAAIGNKMAARLSNGSVYNLTIPETDYAITLTLDGFKKVLAADVAAGRGYVYGAFVTVQVKEPLSNTIFFNQQVRLGANRTQPATGGEINDASVYDTVLQQLFLELTTAIDPLDEAWARKNILPADKSVAALKSFREIVKLCR